MPFLKLKQKFQSLILNKKLEDFGEYFFSVENGKLRKMWKIWKIEENFVKPWKILKIGKNIENC